MRQRGRPRHPDLLTPREWEVLSLVREGLSNREIGDRLGVSRDGIKYHISQILLKLGVATREEAAAWQPPVPAAAPPQTTWLASRFSRITRVGLIGTAGALLVGLVALGGAVAYKELSGGGSNDSSVDALGGPPTASPDAIPTPSPDHTPAPPLLTDGLLGSVAYVKDGNLWVLNLDTGDDRLIVQRSVALTFGTTAQDLTAFDPEWSMDGEWVCFGIRNSKFNVDYVTFVRPQDGSLGGSIVAAGSSWDWSPASDVLAAGGIGLTGYIPNAGGMEFYSSPGRAFFGSTGVGEPKWSPDGSRLAIGDASITFTPSGNVTSGPYRLRIIDPQQVGPTITPTQGDPTGATTIFSEDNAPGAPVVHSWSPDRKYILFWKGVDSTTTANADLALTSVDDPSHIKTIGQSRVVPGVAAWSTAGFLAISSGDSKSIEVFSEDGTLQAHIGGEESASVEPAWSPGGEQIAFAKSGGIWVADKDGSGLTRLTNDNTYSDRNPQWSRDGQRIVFVRLSASAVNQRVSGPADLWMMNSDGSGTHKLADLPAIDLATQALGGFDMDWTQYFSWYRPSDIPPLDPAPSPSPFTFTPVPSGGTVQSEAKRDRRLRTGHPVSPQPATI